jgi:hypothetical protein
MQSEAVAAAPVEEPAALWEDFIDIYIAPARVFARRVDGRFVVALFVLVVLLVVLYYASQGPLDRAFSADYQRQMALMAKAGAKITPEQAERMRAVGSKFALVAIAFSVPMKAVLTGLLIWLVAKPFGSAMSYGVAVMIATYSQFPSVLQAVSGIFQGVLLDPDSLTRLSLGPARFLDPDTSSRVLLGLLARFDLFVLWSAVLVGVGLFVAGRLNKTNAALAAALVWLLGAVPVLLAGLRG